VFLPEVPHSSPHLSPGKTALLKWTITTFDQKYYQQQDNNSDYILEIFKEVIMSNQVTMWAEFTDIRRSIVQLVLQNNQRPEFP
jgi:hypothetical protein